MTEIEYDVWPDDLTDADKPPYTIWMGSHGRHTRLVSLAQTFVFSCKLSDFDENWNSRFTQEAALPTMPVNSTDHVCVGKAVWNALKLRIYGKDWAAWVRDHDGFG